MVEVAVVTKSKARVKLQTTNISILSAQSFYNPDALPVTNRQCRSTEVII